ncbi:MAG TPA: gliding motility-associated C-terminal domain-containing protein [Bacteroidales bacterium]|nr:gliding motility-associated C-terminal domain-containing protein [Bacteroidales bacterium]
MSLSGQYNPFVNTGDVSPAPLSTVEANGTGTVSFITGNSGTDDIIVSENPVVITITLSNGVPDNSNPLGALGGSVAGIYNWTYQNGVYTGTQKSVIPGNSSGAITIAYKVTVNSPESDPKNGFNAVIYPGSSQAGNVVSDDTESAYTWTKCEAPSPPQIGTITQPDCTTATGSVALHGLPSTGSWIITVNPTGRTINGNSGSIHVTGLNPGSYTFTVASGGCESAASESAVINPQPSAPSAPAIGEITQPTCDLATGSVVLNDLPAGGTWNLVRSPGNVSLSGSGTTITIQGLSAGTYTFTVSQEGCRSEASANVVINAAPAVPSSPVYRIDCFLGTGFAVITVTSPVADGYEYRLDDRPFTQSGTFMDIGNGNHTITVRSNDGCTVTSDPFAVACGCVNRPDVTLSSQSGTACTTTPVTVTGNTFSGSATSVSITEDGAGTVSPVTITTSPFSFTYTPAAADAGKQVRITVTSNNPLGSPCNEATTTYTLTVNAVPDAPVPGQVTQPTCTTSTGNLSLSGLPETGTWTIVRSPGNVMTEGTGTTAIIQGLESGNYTFTVTLNGCSSSSSSQVTVDPQPRIPAPPVAGAIVQPTCTVTTGIINLSGLPEGEAWTLTRYPGTINTTGSGVTAKVEGIAPGTYNFTVTGASGCTSALSPNIVINQQPPTPAAPVIGAVTAPTCLKPEGSLVLSGLPDTGRWTITSISGGISLSGTGTSVVVGGLIPGAYSFIVTNEGGCTSPEGAIALIPAIPGAPALVITDPLPVCSPATVDLTSPSVTAGSTAGLTLSYWLDVSATLEFKSPAVATTGKYYIKATDAAQCFVIKPVNVSVLNIPAANAGYDQELDYVFTATLSADEPAPGETGLWSVYSGSGQFTNPSSAITTISNLDAGENVFLWTVTNAVCPSSTDTLSIFVKDLTAPTLITPNNDGINDFFILDGVENFTANELTVFDRRGVLVFRSRDFKNDWNGMDYNGHPLAEDTYFYVLKTGNGKQRSGFIVIRR